jgi:uncharacterized membrane protein
MGKLMLQLIKRHIRLVLVGLMYTVSLYGVRALVHKHTEPHQTAKINNL